MTVILGKYLKAGEFEPESDDDPRLGKAIKLQLTPTEMEQLQQGQGLCRVINGTEHDGLMIAVELKD